MPGVAKWICYIIWIGLLLVVLLSIMAANIYSLSHWLRSRGLPSQFYAFTGRTFFFMQIAIFSFILPFVGYAISGDSELAIIFAVIIVLAVIVYVRMRHGACRR